LTGYEIVLDLIKQLAALSPERPAQEPEAWYAAHLGGAPDYGTLLDALAKSPAERRQLLRRYFEPTEEEREAALKVPTRAHRAIAELARRGHLRIMLTTNFDRLLEQALADVSIVPTVISHPDMIRGALPLVHEPCTLVKLHGDYIDTRLRNTEEEVAVYDPALDQMLDRILDEFGLIICGWSAIWDIALRHALERCGNHRFTTWWAARGPLSEAAQRLVVLRRAEVIPIESADAFFEAVADRVRSVDDLGVSPPPTTAVAVATAKRYLADPAHRIRLYDLVMGEIERAVAGATAAVATAPQPSGTSWSDMRDTIRHIVTGMDAAMETSASLLTVGAFWGTAEHRGIWVQAIERLANSASGGAVSNWRTRLTGYPGLLAFYAAGVGAVAGEQYDTLVDLLLRPRVRSDTELQPAASVLVAEGVFERNAGQQLPGLERHIFPGSDHLHRQLRPILGDIVADDARYNGAFDRWEYLLSLTWVGLTQEGEGVRGPVGRFAWLSNRPGFQLFADIEQELRRAGPKWLLLAAGLFGGVPDRFLEMKKAFDDYARERGGW
jgi:hypothetical protein